jgi:hypothetical protein
VENVRPPHADLWQGHVALWQMIFWELHEFHPRPNWTTDKLGANIATCLPILDCTSGCQKVFIWLVGWVLRQLACQSVGTHTFRFPSTYSLPLPLILLYLYNSTFPTVHCGNLLPTMLGNFSILPKSSCFILGPCGNTDTGWFLITVNYNICMGNT